MKTFVNGNSIPSDYKKNIAAHSMGNIVAGSALTAGMSIENYALLQAAVPAACYDEREVIKQTTVVEKMVGSLTINVWDNETPDDDSDPATRAVAYRGHLKNVAGNLINFYLPDDYATSFAWELNNDVSKPENGPLSADFHYKRNNANGQKLYKYTIPIDEEIVDHYLSDAHEAMPYACRTWGKAVGAEGQTRGSVDGDVDLSSPTFGGSQGFNTEHSAEFNYDIQNLNAFYNQLLESFLIESNP